MAAGGENRWPYMGRNRWPLTLARFGALVRDRRKQTLQDAAFSLNCLVCGILQAGNKDKLETIGELTLPDALIAKEMTCVLI